MKIIVRVRELRKTHNLTQEELAKQLHISRQSLISLEQGRWLPSLPLAIQLAEFFNTPLEHVIMAENQAEQIQQQVHSMIEQATNQGGPAMFPTINIKEDTTHLYIEAHVPGFSQDDIDIDVADDMITINGTSQQSPETDDNGYVQREYHMQSFSRTMTLPTLVVSDQAAAKLANGILTITLPKQTEQKPKSTHLKPSVD